MVTYGKPFDIHFCNLQHLILILNLVDGIRGGQNSVKVSCMLSMFK